jgi:polyferredoxin
MNKKQKKVIWIGLIIFILMGLFPPWIDDVECFNPSSEPSHSGGTVFVTRSYGFLFIPPRGMAFVDLTRLLVQWLLVIAVTAWMVYLKGDQKHKKVNQ